MSGTYTVLVTGANAGLGFATCCRLIDEFLATRPPHESLRIIFTTRDQQKSDGTRARLDNHVRKVIHSVYGTSTHGEIISKQLSRVTLQGVLLDLLSLASVKTLARSLVSSSTHIDALVLNAGIGGWSGINWPRAIWSVLTDVVNATTWPTYKIGYTGRTAEQKALAQKLNSSSCSRLGETFTANVFGHYLLTHWLMPLLKADSHHPAGRVIWISSIEAQADSFDPSDFQAMASDASYESSKRLTDLLVLTSEEPATKSFVDAYLSSSSPSVPADPSPESGDRVRMFVCHPGICATSIAGLALPLHWAMICMFYVARWLGSPWHAIESYVGAMAVVWLALTPKPVLQGLEGEGPSSAKGKWGSSTDRLGHERVLRTDVPGWGWTGSVGDRADGDMKIAVGRHGNAVDLTHEARIEFVDIGRKCWKEMEEMRAYWENRLEHI